MASDPYAAAWSALSKSLRRGFSWSGRERNCAFLNVGSGRPDFADVSAISGLDLDHDGRAAVAVDWDHDGDLDLWMTSRSGPRLRYLRNDLGVQHSVALRPSELRGAGASRDGIGARVELTLSDGRDLVRVRRAGEGLLAQGAGWLHFGLGDPGAEESLEIVGCTVEWPGGEREEFVGVGAGGRFELERGAGRARPVVDGGRTPSARAKPVPAEEAGPTRVVLRSPRPVPALAVETNDGRSARFLGVDTSRGTGTGRPLLVLLWAPWCAPCIGELAGLQDRAAELEVAGLDVLALATSEGAEREEARSRLQSLGWAYSSGFATREAVAVLDVLVGDILDTEERLALPTGLLVDPQGRLLAVYRGPVGAAQVLVDLELVGLDDPQRLAAATPFPGRWANEPATFDKAALAARYRRRGIERPARELELSRVQVRELGKVEFQLTLGRARMRTNDVSGAIDAFREALREDPDSAAAHRELGLALHRQGKQADAVVSYGRSLEIDPADERTRFNRALALAKLGRLAEAEADLADLVARGSELAGELDARLETVRER